MRRLLLLTLLLTFVPALRADDATDLAAARAVFKANLEAIQHHDRAAYLATYLHDDSFAVSTSAGFLRGFDRFAKDDSPWPDAFDASDLELVHVAPGTIYGT